MKANHDQQRPTAGPSSRPVPRRASVGHGSGTYNAKASDGYTDSRSVADEIVKPAASILPMALDASMGNPRWIQHPANPTPQTLGEIHDSRTSKQPILAHRRLPGQPAPDGPRIRVGPSCPGNPGTHEAPPTLFALSPLVHPRWFIRAGSSTPAHPRRKESDRCSRLEPLLREPPRPILLALPPNDRLPEIFQGSASTRA